MKIINRVIMDADIIPNSYMISKAFGCELESIYVFNLEMEDGLDGVATGYYNKSKNEIYILISKRSLDTIQGIGAVLVKEGQYGIEETIIDSDKETLKPFRAIIDELTLYIYEKEHKKN